MTRILVYTSPARGHLYPIVPTLLQLQARGHTIALRTLSADVARMSELGFAAAAIDPAVEALQADDFKGRTPIARLRRAVDTFTARAPFELEDVRRAITEESPGALLIDANSWGASTIAEASGLPWAHWMPYLLPLPSRGAPPWGPGLKPGRGPVVAARDHLLGAVIRRTFNRAGVPPLNAVRARAGVPPVRDTVALFTRSPLMLYLTAGAMEYDRPDWPDSIRMVGPGLWEPDGQTAPEWLDDGDQRPLVLVTISSEFQDDARLVATALEALRDEPVRVVATTLDTDPATFDVPDNARVERFLPHGPLLDRAACVVCHGGMGITQKALARGVPVCIVPFGRDQLETARRVELAEAGTRLPAQRLNPSRLRAAVRQAMDRAAGARRMAEAFERAGGAGAAADAFESLLRSPSHV